VVCDPSQVERVVAGMREYRGENGGGVCVRRVENFMVETELRCFVVHGRAYAAEPAGPVPGVVAACAGRIPKRFFSVDVVPSIRSSVGWPWGEVMIAVAFHFARRPLLPSTVGGEDTAPPSACPCLGRHQ